MVRILPVILTALSLKLVASTISQPITHSVSSRDAIMSEDDIGDLEVSGNSICGNGRCYPKIFEPKHDWQSILPGQELPGGLDIRINMKTGLKEAKLNDEEHDNNSGTNELLIASESVKPSTDDYEFSNDFKEIRSIFDSHSTLSSHDITVLEDKFDNVMEFAHDYKHGYKIIVHEFPLLANVSLNENLSLTLRELSTRVITSCMRNNPPVVEFIDERFAGFKGQVILALSNLNDSNHKFSNILIKRYLSILNELPVTSQDLPIYSTINLQNVYQRNGKDKQLQIKVLELISKILKTGVRKNEDPDEVLYKRNVQKWSPDLQEWANEFQAMAQDKEIDELHMRTFFDTLYNLKSIFKSDITINKAFLNWLAQQCKERQSNLDNGLHERDIEQDTFDKKLINSRHLIFGNPMAHRLKNFRDEL
ncbi:sil1p [Saccharomyces arboricola H-6]|uniref:Nucleotide exchange factor SIL1 n=1 Tax=Saccharomyces arboricola (strain H-6 / AS 2.3317 / CBS 10644) TaxID=1160507 RepID=J8Q2G5_SACAR|nr:sil1p [Saccharomyces arboricola H-6]